MVTQEDTHASVDDDVDDNVHVTIDDDNNDHYGSHNVDDDDDADDNNHRHIEQMNSIIVVDQVDMIPIVPRHASFDKQGIICYDVMIEWIYYG